MGEFQITDMFFNTLRAQVHRPATEPPERAVPATLHMNKRWNVHPLTDALTSC